MAITVNFYSYSKKENSTSSPAGAGASYSCNLKETCSIEAPVIEINAKPASWYNYAYISDFDRYYYVSNWSYYRGIWSAELKVDVLASFKTSIGASSIYVLRSSHTYDKEIKDTMYPTKSEITKVVETGTVSGWASGIAGGTYVAYVNSGKIDPATYGSLAFIYFTPTQFGQLLKALYPDAGTNYNDLFFTQAYNVMAGALFNPIDFITKVVWIPESLNAGSYITMFGNFVAKDSSDNSYIMHGALSQIRNTQTINITIPKRSDTVRGSWANTEPYGKYYLYFAPFGIIQLNSQMLMNASSINCVLTLNRTSGDIQMSISTVGDYGSSKDRLWVGTSNVGLEIPIDKAKSEGIQAFEKTLSAGSIAFDAIIGNYAGLVNDVGTTIGTMGEAPPKSGGSTRGILGLNDTIYLYYEYYDFVDEDNANKGRPLCDTRQISTIPGYIVGSAESINLSCTESELTQIKQHIERGFYYE